MKKILCSIFSILLVTAANAAETPLDKCIKKISEDEQTWKAGLTTIFGDTDLDDSIVDQNKMQIYQLITASFQTLCGENLMSIAKTTQQRAKINFDYKGKEYAFDFSLDRIFDDFGIQTGILVINKRNLAPNSVLKLSDIPKKEKFFPDACSDWTIALSLTDWDHGLDDNAAVNVAGQAVFSEYGGSKSEFFLDFADGDDRRAFPGLVLEDVTWSGEEKIVAYTNIKTALERTQQFYEKLRGGQCSNSGLAVYLVALNVQEASSVTTSGKNNVALGVSAGTGIVGGLGAVAAGTMWIPVAGWAIAGVAGIAAAGFAMMPTKIADIQQVMILDGPYPL